MEESEVVKEIVEVKEEIKKKIEKKEDDIVWKMEEMEVMKKNK